MIRLIRLTLLVPILFAPTGTAQDDEGEGWENLTYEKLRCPKRGPADPLPPNRKGRMDSSWSQICRNSMKMDCFFKRHANSWQITCSLCATEKKCCSKPMVTPAAESEILAQVKVQKKLGGRGVEMAYSPHFLIVLDHRSLKIKTRGGAPRIASKHELLHLFLQRAEMTRRDFEKVFGMAYQGRSAMVMMRSESAQRAFSQSYFGNARTNVLRGYGSGDKVAGGLAGNGFSISAKSDDQLHFQMRHMIGHLLITTYNGANPHPKYCPAWIDKGCAHWLCKLHPRAKNFATFCQHEGVTTTSGSSRSRGGGMGGGPSPGGGGAASGGPSVSGSGAKWHKKAMRIALKGPKKDPVEKMFRAATVKEVDFDLHVRGWSWFDVFTREEREEFVKFISALREATDPRIAAKAAWGQAPELVDDRWRERVLGKRNKVEATKTEKKKSGDVEAASARELGEISSETDLQLLAGRVRGLERCHNVKTARVVVDLLDKRDSDRVREVIAIVLGRTEDADVLAYLRGAGYERAGKMGRATLCRNFGETGDAKAIPVLRKALGDGFWLVRANAARALGKLEDKESIDKIAKLAASGGGKVRVGAMDALALFGADAEKTVPGFQSNLSHSSWQVKIATCDALRAIGSVAPVELLIDRYEIEGGRVKEDVLETLQALTGNQRKYSPDTWRAWWKKAKKWRDLEERGKKELEEEGKSPGRNNDDRYASNKKKKPHYYGIRIYARTVGYVLDISQSMQQGFRVSEEWEERLGHKLPGRTRIAVCKQELAHSIRGLDPRTRINLVFFNDRARLWKSTPVAAGASGANAISAVKNIATKGQTNYYDALRLIMGMKGGAGGWVSDFADTPDTLFFLTDGSPTDGEITDAEELLAWFNERNRFARLRVHVIAMGNTGVDSEFLQKLAESNRGTFVHMSGDY
ncbi:MAG: HEAT repeat domain-containing protein [Planctomycetota bacterium]|jgi:HEAT repeat protein